MSTANLNASIQILSDNVAKLIAQEAGSVPQAAVDASQASVDAVNASVVATLKPVV